MDKLLPTAHDAAHDVTLNQGDNQAFYGSRNQDDLTILFYFERDIGASPLPPQKNDRTEKLLPRLEIYNFVITSHN